MDNNEYIGEKGNTQKFWLALIRDVFGVINPEEYIDFEKSVAIEHVKFIDAYVPSTGIIIEQKSTGKNLDEAFKQAKNYHDWLPLSQRGRYILTCDFNEIHVHDMEAPTKQPTIIPVSEASRDNLAFLLTPGETLPLEIAISVKAGELVKKLYEALLASLNQAVRENNYRTKEEYNERYNKGLEDINVFCVRLVFLLYAEDAGLFRKSQFHDYIAPRAIMASEAFLKLFDVLNTEVHKRDIYQEEALKEFPFVNGGLFDKKVKIPQLDENTKDIIIHDMAEEFNWSGISPTIFGAIFEATLNSETRKIQGMHYTSVKNIHKVIDPLFLDELTKTLDNILKDNSPERTEKLLRFQDKLSKLRFLDTACGSGNFLTESFISLRRLENRILAAIPEDEKCSVKVSITQFNGIEAHDFAVNVAKTALWISNHQMWKETQSIKSAQKPPLPLIDYDGIEEGNALRSGLLIKGWNIQHDDMLYIMGNPPFIGYSQQSQGQKEDVRQLYGQAKVDYVSCWFMTAAEYVQDKNTRAAFVATNSLTQGEQPGFVFKPIRKRYDIKLDFAYQSFVWKNELPDPKKMAHVHVVIIGFSSNPPEKRSLYDAEGNCKLVENINFYLEDGPDEDIAESTNKPISPNVPEMMLGNLPRDGGNLIIELEDYAKFIKKEPKARKYIRRYLGSVEFINNLQRYCLWLVDATPQEIKDMPLVYKRVKAVEKFRQKSPREATRKLANTSWLFAEIRQPEKNYIAIPEVSSQRRYYIPIAWLSPEEIPGHLYTIPDATLYHFGVLTSRVHMAWMRRVGGRLRSDYSYSSTIVYNTFAWTTPTTRQRKSIEKTAQAILDARENIHGSSFAAMYDDSLMPSELRKAHEENDRAVCKAYGWDENISENEIVNELFKLYHKLTGK